MKKLLFILWQCTWGLAQTLLGPLYLLVIGLTSYSWANIPYFRKMRREKNIPYTACFVESWASKWRKWVTKQNAIWN